VLASGVLLTSAIALLTAGVMFTDAMTLAGLRRQLRQAPPADRAIVVRTQVLPGHFAAADAAITPELERALVPTGGELARVVRSAPYADAATDPAAVRNLVVFSSLQGIDRHATLTAGRWPTAGHDPVEVAVSEQAVRKLGLSTGGRLALVGRLDGRRVDALVTGVWEPDATDPYWLGEPLALAGAETGGSFTLLGPLVADAADVMGPLAGSNPVDAQWHAVPDVGGYNPVSMAAASAPLDGLLGRINAALPGSNQATVATKLPTILAAVERSVLVATAGVDLILLQFGILGGYAVLLVAALMVDRRRNGTALLRARGAGLGALTRLSLVEALLLTIPAVLVAPWLATLLVAVVGLDPALAGIGLVAPLPGSGSYVVSMAAGAAAVVILVLPTLVSGANIAGVRAAAGRQLGRTMAQRLGVDLTIVAVATIALLQLRQYGAPLTRTTRGTLGVDPLLVAAPAIGQLAGAILSMRLVPRMAELAERILARRAGLVPALAGRQVARRPLRYTRAALLLVLAAALGTFAAAYSVTWTRSQSDQATFAVGSDVRVTPGSGAGAPDWGLGPALRAIPGVRAATPVVRAGVDLGSAVRDGTLLAVDGQALASVVRLRDDAARTPTLAAIRGLEAGRAATPGLLLPAGTDRLTVVVDSTFSPVPGFAPIPTGYPVLVAAVSVMSEDGRIARIESEPGPANVNGAHLQVALTQPGNGAALQGPVQVLGVDLELSMGDLGGSLADGSVTVRSLAASPADSGDAWTVLPLGDLATGWTFDNGDGPRPYLPPAPGVLQASAVDPGQRAVWSLDVAHVASGAGVVVVPAVANAAFLEKAGARVGDTVKASVVGLPVTLHLVDRIESWPGERPDRPLALVDGLSLALVRFAGGSTPSRAGEWWVATDPGASGAVASAALLAPVSAAAVVDRAALQADLAADALGLSVIGVLGIGSLAALAIAGVGFLVSTTVSTEERIGELALLKSLGLAPRSLLSWLVAESAALLVTGLALGVILGLALAWLVLPFGILTSRGESPVPEPEVVMPAGALLPMVGLAALLLVAAGLLIRRILAAANTSAVLRARDE
jgi:hypothetical protein